MQNLIQGSKATMTIRLVQQVNGFVGDPVDLTGITEVKTCFLQADGVTETMLTLTGGAITILGNPVLGKLAIALTAAQTAALAVMSNSTLELALIYGSTDPVKVQIPNAYAVVPTGC